jgi:hypothetical protein
MEMNAQEHRTWLYDLAEAYASGVKDVNNVLTQHIRKSSDVHLAQVALAERAIYDNDLVMTTPMQLYCAAARRQRHHREPILRTQLARVYFIWHGEDEAHAPEFFAVTAGILAELFMLSSNADPEDGLGWIAKGRISEEHLMEFHQYGYITLLREVER